MLQSIVTGYATKHSRSKTFLLNVQLCYKQLDVTLEIHIILCSYFIVPVQGHDLDSQEKLRQACSIFQIIRMIKSFMYKV